MTILFALSAVLVLGAPVGHPSQASAAAADKAAVHQAALDYVDALYEADPSKIERSVSQKLTKHGFMRGPAGDYGPMLSMTYDQLLVLAGSWNRAKTRDTRIKKIEVLDVFDQTAVARITAQWGIDHMQLAKLDGRWQIINIVWQTHPPVR